MADRRTNTANAFETVLTQEFGPTSLIASLEAVLGLTIPVYLTFDPENELGHREYIDFDDAISGTDISTTSLNNRYLSGSVASSGITHPVGTVVRMTPTKQIFDDLHDRVDGRMAAASHTKSVHDSLGISHSSTSNKSNDDHPQYHNDSRGDARYLRNTGGTLTGPVLLPDGTVAEPSFAFSGDPNTGMRRAAADTVALVAGGADVLLASAGLVGPAAHNTRDLGATATRWRDLYLSRRAHLTAYRETRVDHGALASGATLTINPEVATIHAADASAGPITVAWSGTVADGDSFLLRIFMSTIRAVTWPAGILWSGGTAPELEVGQNVIAFWRDGGTWFGNYTGKFA